jgi:nitroimidazol reductase NimA-like FMN-containing flavoprotein (pyridoxamine 5'-phosphate oxidase superfamily)
MRKPEDYSHDPGEFESIAGAALVGYLGILTPDGYPRVVPLNFVNDGQVIYFHGAGGGEKFNVLKDSPRITFSIDIPYSVIPSYWISKTSAGGATMFFKSALVKGRCRIVEGLEEKIHALELLMKKYQPEGNYKPIRADDPAYQSLLDKTIVFRIDADRFDIKTKFHQKKSAEHKRKLIRLLEERNQGPDLATAALLKELIEPSRE